MDVAVFGLKRKLNKAVVVLLKGGLGNQLFQYAAARGVKGKKDVVVDLSFLSSNNKSSDIFTARQYELQLFSNVKASVASKFLVLTIHNQKLQYRVIRKLLFNRINKVEQKENEFIHLKQSDTPVYLDGHFQSEKYFKHIRNELLQELEFPHLDEKNLSTLNNIYSFTDSVSVHVRRGDYLKSAVSQVHGILPVSYYKSAIELIEKTVKKPHYFIFSDDAEWCISNFSFLENNYTIVQGNASSDAWKDMCLMTKCKHHIIANSSFSWWGAWLNPYKEKIVVAPNKWYADEEKNKNSSDIIPATWIKL